ncbi:MAG: hypothetical protein M1814_001457 [Vezdaea aestivalis]|nr:MAG: hypothetical protein M1814_001457 [Vezdaea aestivalis]
MGLGAFAASPVVLLFFILLLAALVNCHTNFTICGNQWIGDLQQLNSTAVQYKYNGKVRGLKEGQTPPPLITVEGCRAYCGTGHQPYEWDNVADTITTWVLPLVGLILQAPFESNERTSTALVLFRWLGSPISVLMAVFWNIKITGRCALILDMSVKRKEAPGLTKRSYRDIWMKFRQATIERFNNVTIHPTKIKETGQTPFHELRDSLYLLSVLNQYAFDQTQPQAMKRLVLSALFSSRQSTLFDDLQAPVDPLAAPGPQTPEDEEEKQLIPYSPFNLIEARQSLAASVRRSRKQGVVQVLVSLLWFLVALILSIMKAFTDEGDNATTHNLALGLWMGWLPILIAASIVDRNPTNSEYVKQRLEFFLRSVNTRFQDGPQDLQSQNFLTYFCGQGRKAWHYGIAHSILTQIEQAYAHSPRGEILEHYKTNQLVEIGLQRTTGDLWRFDIVEAWQGFLAWLVVFMSTTSAFVLSFNEPTVGVGCRSGGYFVFGLIAAIAWLLEMGGWAIDRLITRSKWILFYLRVLLTIFEIFNAIWLVTSIMRQTFGSYNTCDCKSSIWMAGQGGYTDFTLTSKDYKSLYDVSRAWYASTVTGMLPLLLIIYIVYEWCVQSFLWTENYDAAMRGLLRVRRWKTIFHWRWLYHLLFISPVEVGYSMFSTSEMPGRLEFAR